MGDVKTILVTGVAGPWGARVARRLLQQPDLHVIGVDTAVPAEPGWLQIQCNSEGQARWLAEAIKEENVQARFEGAWLLVPVGDDFRLKKEIKNVITAVAKTTHYWQEHLAVEVKQALAFQEKLGAIWRKVKQVIR